ncbi:RNA methylase family protein [Mytilinidion resinicola]|uniref:RNA methylase family protein n=1 Tax=Mytilinidion resinicola TaxID=574789 RepID=A0A6A6YZW7_9PEZI|nr:RNA methylase family protein [Mytilinidion resinicola]KAF2813517.1 RNA methylase family protein [Mytilinidion resinicola]
MPQYLVRLAQTHESFRKAELEALAELAGIDIRFDFYDEDSPFCILALPSPTAAAILIHRSILSLSIHELWAQGTDYATLHASNHAASSIFWPHYATSSFRFTLDSYRGSRSTATQRTIIDSFSYMPLNGRIKMSNPDLSLTIFEDFATGSHEPRALYLGRLLSLSGRIAKTTYDLKKRAYISTTSMDAELALVTANVALAAPGKLFYDPFSGTGGFMVAGAHFGASVWGSDIDGRSIRGKGGKAKKDVVSNMVQYGLTSRYLDGFIADLTNSPIRGARGPGEDAARGGWLDGIMCDPPYGVREGLKVLGLKRDPGENRERLACVDRYMEEGYIPPKRPYSFEAMLEDILQFAAVMLVVGGRLSMWMPTANEEAENGEEQKELSIPMHPALGLVSVCVQPFNKWSRRLLTYRRLSPDEISPEALSAMVSHKKRAHGNGQNADDLNDFRRKYFQGFKEPET